ncbi:MAG: branched-chain alpha-keto acid dehydrogenase subunit [Chloroflexi bacterium]|nr:branched-chain alpha-keto acid dehydrogenase subunit [Chloroflexota bacterium]
MAKVTMPQLGESVAEGTIGRWLKEPGDRVAKDEPLVEVITDKVNAEVPAPFGGMLVEILAPEGATVPAGAEIAVLTEGDEAVPERTPALEPGTATPAPAGAAAPSTAAAPPVEPAPQIAPPASAPAVPVAAGPMSVPAPAASAALPAIGRPDARMTPSVRRLLREHGLAPEQVPGSGMGGRITRADIMAAVGRSVAGAPPGAPAPVSRPAAGAARPASTALVFPPGADELLVPMSRMRRGIADQMTRALAVPTAYVQVEVDATNLVRLREGVKAEYQAREGISLSYVALVARAVIEALRHRPTFNAHWTDAGLLAMRRIHLGVAVAVDDGLVVPVVRDADTLSVHGINRAIADVAARARAGRFRVDDFGGATFTVDNTGWYGSIVTLPIINVPEVAILTMEAITRRPVVVTSPEGEAIAIRPVMNMVVAIDHRANDGAGAGFFLRDVKAWLEAVGPETAIW